MSNLPNEMLDNIVDNLHDDRPALRNCCLVSKSWIPRSRRNLFAEVRFDPAKKTRMRSYLKIFRNPSTSPTRYTKTLFISRPDVIMGVEGWISGFSRVVRLHLAGRDPFPNRPITLTPFLGFSPVLKSLLVDSFTLPPSHLFDLILSFPLLEDLTVIRCHDVPTDEANDPAGLPIATQPTSPPMTGSLTLPQRGGLGSVARWLLSLPGGIHFRRLALSLWGGEDDLLARALVKECSHNLKSLELFCAAHGTPILYFTCAPTTYTRSQLRGSLPQSTSRRRRGSKIWLSGLARRGLTGSARHSE